MGEKTLIDDYREQVRQIMLKATKENGEPRLTEKEVKDILTSFSDEDLAFGMPLLYSESNTPCKNKKIGVDFSLRYSSVGRLSASHIRLLTN